MMRLISRGIDSAAQFLVVVFFGILLVIGAAQVLTRFAGFPLDWSEELLKFTHVWLVFLAIPIAYDRGSHICVDLVVAHVPPPWQSVFAVVIDLLWLALAVAFIYYTWVIMGVTRRQTSAGLLIRMDLVYFGIVIGMGYLFMCAIRKLLCRFAGFFKNKEDVQ